MFDNNNNNAPSSSSDHHPDSSSDKPLPTTTTTSPNNSNSNSNSRRKRKPAGTPDPDAEVVSLSPKTLLESDRYVCEICNQGFQRDQNLQMHRRRHKVPWKLLKRSETSTTQEVKKRVFVCPEPSCLHHDPCHALGDLVGIKKHFRRKHSNHKQWVCDKCSKAYAVQSDYKAHLKTCGTRGHSCDCGRVFSRVESFIEHQDVCTVRRVRPDQLHAQAAACSSRTASSTSPSSDAAAANANFSMTPLSNTLPPSHQPAFLFSSQNNNIMNDDQSKQKQQEEDQDQEHNLELQLLLPSPSSSRTRHMIPPMSDDTHLMLTIGSNNSNNNINNSSDYARVKEFANEQMKLAEEAREHAKRQIEIAELEFENAKKIRRQAQAELEKAEALKKQAMKKISNTLMEITCQACKRHFQAPVPTVGASGSGLMAAALAPTTTTQDESSLAMSYNMSSPTTEGEGE
ncbi:hypothetical protein ACFE04_020497 [Oxalis oulophora]